MALSRIQALLTAQRDAVNTQLGASCIMDVYSGTVPADVTVAITSQILLVSLTLNPTPFAIPNSAGLALSNTITSGTAVATGLASFFRLRNGATVIIQEQAGGPATSPGLALAGDGNIAIGTVVSIASGALTYQV